MAYLKALVAVFVLLLFAAIPAAAQRDDWVEVSSPLEGFFSRMPGKAEKRTEEGAEGRYSIYFYSEAKGADRSVLMVVAHVALKTQPDDTKALLKWEIEYFTKALEVINPKVVSMNRRDYEAPDYSLRDGRLSPRMRNYPGVEAKVKADRNTILYRVFVDAARRRLFLLEYFAADERYSEAEAKRFFDSFSLLY